MTDRPAVVFDPLLTLPELAALPKCKSDQAERLNPGEHAINLLIRVTGAIRKGEPEMYCPTSSIPIKRALAFFLQFSGLAGEAALACLIQAMSAALNKDLPVDLAVIDAAEAEVKRSLGEMPKLVREAKVCLIDDLLIRRKAR